MLFLSGLYRVTVNRTFVFSILIKNLENDPCGISVSVVSTESTVFFSFQIPELFPSKRRSHVVEASLWNHERYVICFFPPLALQPPCALASGCFSFMIILQMVGLL
jgi:hypothetical protein